MILLIINCGIYRRLKLLIDELKKSNEEQEDNSTPEDYCSETDNEENDCMLNSESDEFCFPKKTYRSEILTPGEELSDDNVPIMSLYQSTKGSSRKTSHKGSPANSTMQVDQSPKSVTKQTSKHQAVVGRKRVRVILSDDDDDDDEMECSSRKDHDCLLENLPNCDASMLSLLVALL